MTKTETKTNAHKEAVARYYGEKVPVTLHRPEGVKENYTTVTVNGKNYQIRYGVEVLVPRSVKLVLDESARNKEIAEDRAAEQARAFMEGLSLGTR